MFHYVIFPTLLCREKLCLAILFDIELPAEQSPTRSGGFPRPRCMVSQGEAGKEGMGSATRNTVIDGVCGRRGISLWKVDGGLGTRALRHS